MEYIGKSLPKERLIQFYTTLVIKPLLTRILCCKEKEYYGPFI